jgi:hypothetical protein
MERIMDNIPRAYGLSCLACNRSFDVHASFEIDGPATYTHCPDCLQLIKLWGEDDFFISSEEEAFL